jgi:hypothetical protein
MPRCWADSSRQLEYTHRKASMHVSLEGMKVDAPLDNPRGSIGRAENFSIALQHTQSHIRMPPAEISSRIQEISP